MKTKALNLLLILTSLVGYLQWGKNQDLFLFEAEAILFTKFMHDPGSILHPFILLPLLGQILLFITLFQQVPHKWITFSGIICLGILLGFMLFVGVISFNYKICLSTLPFLVLALLVVRNFNSKKQIKK